mmetsp:Transcript_6795/g.5944  ORF Transcript_6795/g.5944 Transcript_6795/m.5944 type:complete len:102 (+) Transcript_6795:177-482(+)
MELDCAQDTHKDLIIKTSDKEFPTFKTLVVKNINVFKGSEKDSLNEFFHGTTPVPPNYLENFRLTGGGEMIILYIDKLIHTLDVVKQEIEIEDFNIDEASL